MFNNPLAIVFVHTGYSAYLPETLGVAKATNPGARLFLIGDQHNQDVAAACGWTHVRMDSIDARSLSEFRDSYTLIASPDHPDVHLKFDMTRFCFERYFLAAAMAEREGLSHFWMLDSDDCILENLEGFQDQLLRGGHRFTRMAHGTALRGLMYLPVVQDYCRHVVQQFRDPAFVEARKAEFQVRTLAAFTDMNSAALFQTKENGVHLADAIEGWHFDDCIMHDDGFETAAIGALTQTRIKNVSFDGHHFIGRRGGASVKFATVNGSGLPHQMFAWFHDCVRFRRDGGSPPKQLTAYQPTLTRELLYLAKRRVMNLVRAW